MVDRYFNEQSRLRKIEQARREREEQQRAEELRKQREAARRKPHCSSSWDDPSFCRRVLRRAERDMAIRAQIRADLASGSFTRRPTATAQWERAMKAALVVSGGNRQQALALADKENPGLREQMLREVNAKR